MPKQFATCFKTVFGEQVPVSLKIFSLQYIFLLG